MGPAYSGESLRTFGKGLEEPIRAPSPIYDHASITGYHTSLDNFTIVGRESHNLAGTIKETIYIRFNDPSLNRNIGKYQLLHI